ncbi:MAG: hypothetical protein HY757_00395, partial [Nitrospirae bacterium]|nr:hypothetical protein [Nitrospirota bacterium]
PYGTYWLNPSLAWVNSAAPISVGQYQLSDLPVTSILNAALPAGLYQFVFILDEKPNGLLDDMSNGSRGMVYITP